MKSNDYLELNANSKKVLNQLKKKNNATILTINNFKGGVGKSTLVDLFSYILEKKKIKTLLIDSDPQRTLTKKVLNNFKIQSKANKTFMEGIRNETLKDSISVLSPYLSIVEGDWELSNLERYSRDNLKADAEYFLYALLIDELKSDYDLIIFDTVPTTSIFTHNCIVASDYVIAPTQAERESFDNTISFIHYLSSMKKYNKELDIIGIVPYLSELDNSTNLKYLSLFQEKFEELIFENIIKRSARVMTWGTNGITENKGYDKQTLRMYTNVFEEFLSRLEIQE